MQCDIRLNQRLNMYLCPLSSSKKCFWKTWQAPMATPPVTTVPRETFPTAFTTRPVRVPKNLWSHRPIAVRRPLRCNRVLVLRVPFPTAEGKEALRASSRRAAPRLVRLSRLWTMGKLPRSAREGVSGCAVSGPMVPVSKVGL